MKHEAFESASFELTSESSRRRNCLAAGTQCVERARGGGPTGPGWASNFYMHIIFFYLHVGNLLRQGFRLSRLILYDAGRKGALKKEVGSPLYTYIYMHTEDFYKNDSTVEVYTS